MEWVTLDGGKAHTMLRLDSITFVSIERYDDKRDMLIVGNNKVQGSIRPEEQERVLAQLHLRIERVPAPAPLAWANPAFVNTEGTLIPTLVPLDNVIL
jgi:hypothetical protein